MLGNFVHKALARKDATEENCIKFSRDHPLNIPTSDINGQTTCKSGDNIEVTVTSPNKWLLNWVEVFHPLQQPFVGTLQYFLPESPNTLFPLYFSKPMFYLPDDATPVFTLSIYKGGRLLNICTVCSY
jgi:hypothetical protein